MKYWDENDRQRTLKIDRNSAVIYNGALAAEEVDKLLNLERYELKVVKSSGEHPDVVVISAYENIVVGSIDTGNYTVYDKTVPTRKQVLDSSAYDRLWIEVNGKRDADFNQIAVGDVLSIFESQDKRVLRCVVSREVVTGVVNESTQENTGKNVVIDGNIYFLPTDVERFGIVVGKSVTAYVDKYGVIAYMDEAADEADDFFAAYLMKANLQGSAFSMKLLIKGTSKN